MNTMEDVYDHIGGLGRFQIFMILGVYPIKSMVGWSMMVIAFAGLIPDFQCETGQSTFEATDTSYENTTLNVCFVNGTECTHFKFLGSKRTVISEWDLVCDKKWIKASIASIQMLGVLLGALAGGQLGDAFGRRRTLYGSQVYHVAVNVLAAFSVSWEMFAATRFLVGVAIGSILVLVVPYPVEFFPVRWRALLSVFPMWPLGVALFALFAYFLEDWVVLHLLCAAFSALTLIGFFFAPESVRWLAVHGRLEEAKTVLQKMARVNRKSLPEYTDDVLKRIAKEEKTSREGKQYSYLDIFKGKRMARQTFIFGLEWLTITIVFYGLSFGVSSLAGNVYLNIFLMATVELPVVISIFYCVNRFGRKPTSMVYFALACLASFGCLLARLKAPESSRGQIVSILSLTAKVGIGGAWAASQAWVIEAYPTVTRSMGYGSANTAARIGGILAPFAVNLDDMMEFSYSLLGIMLLVTLLLLPLIPETKDAVLAESMGNTAQNIEVALEQEEKETLKSPKV